MTDNGSNSSLATLRKELVERGFYEKRPVKVVIEMLFKLFLAAGGMYVFITAANPWMRICAIIISTAGSIGVGTSTHTSSHNATSDKKWVNDWLTYFGYPFFLGFSATYWWNQHIAIHHPSPNVIGVDFDADLSPWFAVTEEDLSRSSGLRRIYYEKFQWLAFPVALFLYGFQTQRLGLVYVFRSLLDPKRRKRAHFIDLGALLLHFSLTMILPLFFFGWKSVLAIYIIRIGLMGYATFFILGPGHLPAEAVYIRRDLKNEDHLLSQTATTVNFRTGIIGRMICSGLEYQVEHHLFPNLCHFYYPQVSVIVERFCHEQGLPYRSYGWGHALWKCWMIFRKPQRIETNFGRLPIAEAEPQVSSQ